MIPENFVFNLYNSQIPYNSCNMIHESLFTQCIGNVYCRIQAVPSISVAIRENIGKKINSRVIDRAHVYEEVIALRWKTKGKRLNHSIGSQTDRHSASYGQSRTHSSMIISGI